MSDRDTDLNRFTLGAANSQDPTKGVHTQNVQRLFAQVAQLMSGFGYDDVIDCSANLLINALRQKYPKRRDALEKYSEIVTKVGNLIAANYDPTTGNRRNVFPFTQTIDLNHFRDPDK